MTTVDYRQIYPNAPIFSFLHRAKQQNCDVTQLMARSAVTVEELRLDVAWEARHHMPDHIGCRICGEFSTWRISGNDGHLWVVHQITTSEYRAAYPGARLFSFTCIASKKERLDVQEWMAREADDHLTPEAANECRADMQWEKHHKITDAVICRECCQKIRQDLAAHIKRRHQMRLAEYRNKWKGAPTRSDAKRTRDVEWWAKHPEEAIAKNAKQNQRKKEELTRLRQLAAQVAPSSGNGAVEPKVRKKVGRPKGMEQQTIQEAHALERFKSEFQRREGTEKGSLQYASRKVYGPTVPLWKAVTRASKTLTKLRKNMGTKPTT
jgi:hypothetical protein